MKDKIMSIVYEALNDLNEELELDILHNPNLKTKIFGTNGALDSINLVSLIADLEERISEEFGKDLVLANEKAMSQKVSPFRNVEALTDYINQLLNE